MIIFVGLPDDVCLAVDNTDAEGRLVLADALYYASSVYKPTTVIGRSYLLSNAQIQTDPLA